MPAVALWSVGALVCASLPALAKDEDDEASEAASPKIYLDLATTVATVPANTIALGISNGGPLLSRLSLSSPAALGVSVNAPLTIDLTDRFSLFTGVNGSATLPDNASWSAFQIDSWTIGFNADLYEQKGGVFPTVNLQSTLSVPTTGGPFATTSLDSNLEFNYALDDDETRGVLGGIRYTKISVDSSIATVDSPIVGYVGGYYQWPSNWKFTARAGVQQFGGVHVGGLTPVKPFTQPILRFDLDRMDDDDNRLYGLTAQIAWTPAASYSLVLRTPLYLVKD